MRTSMMYEEKEEKRKGHICINLIDTKSNFYVGG